MYNPFIKTAIKRKDLSRPTKHLLDNGFISGSVIDFGCGHGEDYLRLKELGFNICGYDEYNTIYKDDSLLNLHYDMVVCNYVFNVIPTLSEHKNVLERLKRLSNNIYISVRADKKAIKSDWKYHPNDLGYWTNKGSFQRFYDIKMIEELFGDVDVIKKTSSFILFKLI